MCQVDNHQCYWLLKEPTADLDLVERSNRRLAALLNGDIVGDRARVLRVPGFLNLKYQERRGRYLEGLRPVGDWSQ